MNKIYYVIAHLSNGDVRIAPKSPTYDCNLDRVVELPGFFDAEEAQRVVDAHKETLPGVEIEIVPKWWNMGESIGEIIGKAENGKWCPVTIEKLKDAIRDRLRAEAEDCDGIDFICKNKLCSIYIDDEGNYHFETEDINGEVKEKTLPINLDWFNLHNFIPHINWTFLEDAAKIFLELLKK